ncbi:MAG TPA: diaminopimelate decarboxylase [Burkholderiales bacterium]|nr:diaminopimelate decarboxylase [Burkholderiales bacterium]
MNPLSYKNSELCAEDVPLASIAAAQGTPTFVYSRAALTHAYTAFTAAFAGHDHLICYAVKANSSLAILDLFARLGSGFDIVSGGELARVLAAGGDPGKIVFSGVGKSEAAIRAALEARILCFNVESASELARLNRIAGELGVRASVSLRVNPDVDAGTHPYIATGLKQNKFGIAYADAPSLYQRARDLQHVQITGIDCHIGSQLTELAPIAEALTKIAELVTRLEAMGIGLQHVDVGGGIGIRYRDETPPAIIDYAAAVLSSFGCGRYKLLFEPGRVLTGNAGVLLTRIEYLKAGEERNFAIIDAAMNDLLRPALYDAWHEVLPVREHGRTDETLQSYDVVGPVCETGDFLARGRELAVREGDLLAIMSAGAYGMSMASNYNSRPRAAEVLVDGDTTLLIREREEFSDLIARERRLPA